MRQHTAKSALFLLGGAFVLGLLALASMLGQGSSQAEDATMHNCPQASKWSIAVWDGDDGTDAAQAFATCGAVPVAAAYHIDPDTQVWLRWFDGRPEVSTLTTLDNMQGIIALGAAGAPTPSPTPAPTPTPTATPIVFQWSDEDLSFHLDTERFKVEWTLTSDWYMVAWWEFTVYRQEDGFETVVCSDGANRVLPQSNSKECEGGPGDFRLAESGAPSWTVRITPIAG